MLKLYKYIFRMVFPSDDSVKTYLNENLQIKNFNLKLKNNKKYILTSLFNFSDPIIRNYIHMLKFNKDNDVIEALSYIFEDYIMSNISNILEMYPEKNIRIVSVPLSTKRLRERGYNQIDIILNEIIIRNNSLKKYINVNQKILTKIKDTKHQTQLSKRERLNNLMEAFDITKNVDINILRKSKIFLIDDVITTGATVYEIINTFSKYKIYDIHIITLSKKYA